MSKLISAQEYANLHGVDPTLIRRLCADNRIQGVTRVGRQWVIPDDASFPEDRRIKSGRYIGWRKPKETNE